MKSFLKQSISNGALAIGLALGVSSCVAPVNLNFDSARMMEKGSFEVQPSISQYTYDGESSNSNLGLKLSFAPKDNYSIKLRGEALMDPFFDVHSKHEVGMFFFEIDNKFGFKEGEMKDRMAFSLPLGIYTVGESASFQLDPRWYITFPKNDKFEFTIVPKCHILFGDGMSIMPAISAGFGFSTNLDEWAIRPEFGYDSYFSFGVGCSYYLTKKK